MDEKRRAKRTVEEIKMAENRAAEEENSLHTLHTADSPELSEVPPIPPIPESADPAEELAAWIEEDRKILARRKKKKRISRVCNIAIALFSLVFVVSGVKLGIEYAKYSKSDKVQSEQRELYKPDIPKKDIGDPFRPNLPPVNIDASGSGDASSEPAGSEVQSDNRVAQAQRVYPDVCGWINIDGTNIDNLYVRGRTYDDYLRSDLDGKYDIAGTLFLDPLCERDFTCFNTVMYGHNMRAGTMFGDLDLFEKTDYWNEHPTGTVVLASETYALQIFAFLVVKSDNPVLYDPFNIDFPEKRANFISYIKANARQYREVGVTIEDTFLTMSTCSYEYDDARCILVARLMNYAG